MAALYSDINSAIGGFAYLLQGRNAIRRAANGIIYAVYPDYSGDCVDLATSLDDGVTWSNEPINKTFDVDINDTEYTSIAIDSSNNLHIVYLQLPKIYYVKKTVANEEEPWSDPLQISTGENESDIPNCEIDDNNDVHIVWVDIESSPWLINYKCQINGVWQDTETDVFPTDDDSYNSQIAVDNNGDIGVICRYWYAPMSMVYTLFCKKTNGVWGSNETVDISTQTGDEIIADNNNNFHIVYQKKNSSAFVIGNATTFTPDPGENTDYLKVTINGSNVIDDIDLNACYSISDVVNALNGVLGVLGKAGVIPEGYLIVRSNASGSSSTINITNGTSATVNTCEKLFGVESISDTGITASVFYRKRNSDGSWDDSEEVDTFSGGTLIGDMVISIATSGTVYCMYSKRTTGGGNITKYNSRVSGVWGTPVTFISISDGIGGDVWITAARCSVFPKYNNISVNIPQVGFCIGFYDESLNNYVYFCSGLIDGGGGDDEFDEADTPTYDDFTKPIKFYSKTDGNPVVFYSRPNSAPVVFYER